MNSPRLTLGSAVLVIVLAATAVIAARPGEPVTQVQAKSSSTNRGLTLWWVFAARDLATCRSPAYAFRHLRSELAGRLDFTAYGLDVDEQDARSFLRSERLDVDLAHPSRHMLPASLGNAPKPGLYLTKGDSLLRAFPSGISHTYPDLPALRAAIVPFLPRPTATAAATVPSKLGGRDAILHPALFAVGHHPRCDARKCVSVLAGRGPFRAWRNVRPLEGSRRKSLVRRNVRSRSAVLQLHDRLAVSPTEPLALGRI
jgi:hypothetical protein